MTIQTTYQVDGMHCGHCAHAVTEELSKLPGVQDVAVDVAGGKVSVHSLRPLPAEAVRDAVDEAGYALAGTR